MFTAFKMYRNKVNSEIKKARHTYYEEVFATIKYDPRKTWAKVKDINCVCTSPVVSIATASGLVSGKEAASALNVYFLNFCENTSTNIEDVEGVAPQAPDVANSISLTAVTPPAVEGIISKIKNNDAADFIIFYAYQTL